MHLIFITLGFVAITSGAFLRKKKWLCISLLSVGAIMCAYPFVHARILTKDAFNWKIVVERALPESGDPKPIYIEDIEWITSYEKVERVRGDIRPFFLRGETVRKEIDIKGYIPIAIDVDIVIGGIEHTITRNINGLPAGSYVFTLSINEKNISSWSVEAMETIANG